jgi:alkaline phosphatase D
MKLLPILLLAAASAHAQIAQGPMLGALTPTSATVWVRTTGPASVEVQLTQEAQQGMVYLGPVHVDASTDFTVQLPLALAPAGVFDYTVGVTLDGQDEVWSGQYRFASPATQPDSVSFVVLSDFPNKQTASQATAAALSTQPDFVAVIGDLDHSDPATNQGVFYPPEQWPTVLENLRAEHRNARDPSTAIGQSFSHMLGAPDSGALQIPFYYAWDDHDFCANNEGADCPFALQAVEAFNEYEVSAVDSGMPSGCGDFESFSYGTVLQVWMLDARSQRGAKTMLGACQLAWLEGELAASTAKWKVILSPVPWNATIKPWDSFDDFMPERKALIKFIAQRGVQGAMVISGDVHTGGAMDDGTHSGLPELSVPHAGMPDTWVNTYCRAEQKNTVLTSRPGSWTIGQLTDPVLDTLPLHCMSNNFPANFPRDRMPAPVYPLDGTGAPGYVRVTATMSGVTAAVFDASGVARSGVLANGTPAPLQIVMGSR